MSILSRLFGGQRDTPDSRDYYFSQQPGTNVPIEPYINLVDQLPPVYHQTILGSCTANAGCGLLAFLYPGFYGSRLQLYWSARSFDGTTATDSGAQTRSLMKALQKIGAAPDEMWPYLVDRYSDMPPTDVLNAAQSHRIGVYLRLQSREDMLKCLSTRQPFITSIDVPHYFNSWEMAKTGVMEVPAVKDFPSRHCMLVVGHDLNFKANPDYLDSGIPQHMVENEAFLVRNSWGDDWGSKRFPGHCWIPMSWLTTESSGGDSWTGYRLVTHIDERGGPSVLGIKIEAEKVEKNTP